VLFDAIVDRRAGGSKLSEHRIQVANTVVHHRLLLAPAEIVGVVGEGRPHGLIAVDGR